MNTALEDGLHRSLTEHALIAPGDSVLVAVSGGPDSLALLHALHDLCGELGLAALHAAHFDHQLRGMESAADAAFVSAFCTRLSIPCHLGAADIAALARATHTSKQTAARQARYRFLETTASQIGAEKIATAHTRDDQIETVLFNILRGTGLDGLRGIPRRRGPYVRPLREVSHADVLAYCEAQSLTPRQDPSNLKTDYTRNRLRLDLLPQLARDYNSAVGSALLRLSEIADRDADYLHQQAQSAFADAVLASDTSMLTLDCAKLRPLHPAMLRHVLRAALAQFRGTSDGLTHEHLEPICDAVTGRRQLPFGLTTPAPHCSVRVTTRRLILRPRPNLSQTENLASAGSP